MAPEAVIAILLAAWAPTAILATFLKLRDVKRHSDMVRMARSGAACKGGQP